MIIHLCGPDRFRRQEKLNAIVAEYRKKHSGLTVRDVDVAEEGGIDALAAAFGAQSLFGAKQLVVARDMFPIANGAEKRVKALLKNAADDAATTLIISADDAPPKAFAFLLEKPCMVQEFPVLLGRQFEAFIKLQAARVGARLTPQLLIDLARVHAGDSWGVVTELERLALQQRGAVEAKRVVASGQQLFYEIGKLAALGTRYGLPLLERLFVNEDPAKIFNMLAYQTGAAGKRQFADYDVAIKMGKLNYEEALTDYVLGK